MQLEPVILKLPGAAIAAVVVVVVLVSMGRSSYGTTAQRTAVLLLRTVAAVILAVVFLNPVSVSGGRPTNRKPVLVIAVDRSRSMSQTDKSGATRYSRVADGLLTQKALLEALSAAFDVHWMQFDAAARTAQPEQLLRDRKPEGPSSNLAQAVAAAGESAGSGGQVLLVSDGRDTEESSPTDTARMLKSRGITVHTLTVGEAAVVRDAEVLALQNRVAAQPNAAAEISAEVRLRGGVRPARIELRENGRVLQSQPLTAAPTQRIAFEVSAGRTGIRRLTLEIPPVEAELTDTNNRAGVLLTVNDWRGRVLLLEGRPNWDSRFLVQTLQKDPAVKLDVIYKLTDQKFYGILSDGETEQGITLPRTMEQLSKYDVLILGRGFEEFYDQQAAETLRHWVEEKGGHLVLLRGRPDEHTETLRSLEPVVWSTSQVEEMRLQLTREGRSYPGFAVGGAAGADTVVRRLPGLISASRVMGARAMAVVLATGAPEDGMGEMALLAWQRIGHGKVLAMAGQGLWRWAFLPPEMEDLKSVYSSFWRQTIGWLITDSDFLPGQGVALRVESSSVPVGEEARVLGFIRSGADIPDALNLFLPDGTTRRIPTYANAPNSAFAAVFRPAQSGEYLISATGQKGRPGPVVSVRADRGSREDIDPSADPDTMRRIASAGGGTAFTLSDADQLPARARTISAASQPQVRRTTAWDRPWVLALLSFSLIAEWWFRRRMG
jgi:hypothetical protein